ncbi:hypothetical protein RNZ50_21410 [Paracoccaceae bacterium Fryx2]|nr:hypothetical protein [Paracoccaceae bacterium Fryx2]
MIFMLSPATIWNSAALKTRHLPRVVFGRIMLVPRRGVSAGLILRLMVEMQFLRYLVPLLPFVAGMLIWPQSALPISQAPIPMLLVIYAVETTVLHIPYTRRARLIDPAAAERGLDLLRVRATAILTRIAAGRGLADGRLHLVVEQSALARVAPLTLVSVQSEDGPELLVLSAEESALIRDTLFAPGLDERLLQRINLAANTFVRDTVLEVRSISAHARLAAMMP